MSDAYKARERQALVNLAWATLSDPKASPKERRAARERLESSSISIGTQYDWSRVPLDERLAALAALRKARVPAPVAHATTHASNLDEE